MKINNWDSKITKKDNDDDLDDLIKSLDEDTSDVTDKKEKKIGKGYLNIPDDYMSCFVNGDLSYREIKIILYIMKIKRGLKYHKKITRKNIVKDTGINQNVVNIPINKLIERNIIYKEDDDYNLNMDIEKWKVNWTPINFY